MKKLVTARTPTWRAALAALLLAAAATAPAPARAQGNLGNLYQNLYISTHPALGVTEAPKPDRTPWVLIVLGIGALVYRRRIGSAFRRWQARRPASASPPSGSPPPTRPMADATRTSAERAGADRVTPASRETLGA